MDIDRETQNKVQSFVKSLTRANEAEINNFISEILSDTKLEASLASKSDFGSGEKPFSYRIAVDTASRLALYVICRAVKPAVVVETGVASGTSSSYILRALDKNAKGKLYSIDVPWYTVTHNWKAAFTDKDPKAQAIELQSGWIIPDYLRDRWELTMGMTNEKLPPLLQNVGPVDVFFHDSEHSYENMSWEFRTIWPALKKNGVMLVHNIDKTAAFSEFEQNVGGKSFKLSGLNNDQKMMLIGGKIKE
jgi:predicted O-methyltransferase YrrM